MICMFVWQRIERAKHLMLTTDEPLARIALDCGLADQSHLTRLFRTRVGMSPQSWRREQGAALLLEV
ncbi:helix-turn-helix domain-containing protein [Indioceanicola profundi]|uniref:helix-turn-helix domain-containing protein n=1 Tax=Indioceanicola profundi TaxID=2220096 RepID=UPI001CEDCBA4|nr:helix-turn-helix domain-containing protein [Indioceanicola profundi]